MEVNERFRKGERITWFGIGGNLILVLFKGTAGIVGRSQAMIADAVESISDTVTTVVALISLKISKKPVDENHPYGHGKIESIAAALIGIGLSVAGLAILGLAIFAMLKGRKESPGVIALWVAIITIIIKEIMYRYTVQAGKKLGSSVIVANAWDHRKDAFTSFATLAGIAGARAGYPFLDPLAAGFVAIFIVWISFGITRNSVQELMDISPPLPILKKITDISEKVEGVEHVHEIKARKIGQYMIVDLKLEIDSKMTVEESHSIAGQVKHEIRKRMENVSDVMVHINPHVEHE